MTIEYYVFGIPGNLEEFLAKLVSKNVNDLQLIYRGSVPKQNLYRVRHIARAGTLELQLRKYNLSINNCQPFSQIVQASVDSYVADVQNARAKGFSVTPEVRELAKYDWNSLTMNLESDLPKLKKDIEARLKSD